MIGVTEHDLRASEIHFDCMSATVLIVDPLANEIVDFHRSAKIEKFGGVNGLGLRR